MDTVTQVLMHDQALRVASGLGQSGVDWPPSLSALGPTLRTLVSSWALARLSTAMARKTFSKVSGRLQVRKGILCPHTAPRGHTGPPKIPINLCPLPRHPRPL